MDGKHVYILAENGFDMKLSDGAVVSLKYDKDLYNTEYILEGKRFGDLFVTFRKPEGDWNSVYTAELAREGKIQYRLNEMGSQYSVTYVVGNGCVRDITIDISYYLNGRSLLYTVKVTNNSTESIELGDLAIAFPMNSLFAWGKDATESVIRHSFISGHNSYMFWMRCNGVGPYLLMTPTGGAKLEYFDMYKEGESEGQQQYRAYIHSASQSQVAKKKGCKWRQPNTSITLPCSGSKGDSISYSFKFQWASGYDDVRELIVGEGLIDIQVIPGMTVPNNLFAMFYLRTKLPIHSVDPEFPHMTELEYVGRKEDDLHIYKVKFSRLGENLITVKYGDNKSMVIEFFATEPIETLIKKRAAFITKCQHRDPEKWYNGLISEWNMETQVLLSPDNYDRIKGWRIYAVSCDDPGLSKPAFLAAKNVEYPEQKEVEALDYYIEHFVWGGLQRTDNEEYSYGIYGIPDWRVNRCSEDEGPRGKLHIWRIYDYPHVVLIYWSMYKIAKNYPHINTFLFSEEYLERAYRTALALFTIPIETGDWPAYNTGLYNELVIEDLINEMYALGWKEKAYRLQRHWDKKVRFFVNENPDIFGSEYPYDTTGFESTHAFAKYASKTAVKLVDENADKKQLITYNNARKFMDSQMECNIACRGWLEPAYYLLGSDYRGSGNAGYTLSYMSQMGGWAILDYALYFSDDPYRYIRLGYASYLSSWALMNTGLPETSYGYWYPGQENDGGAGGGFEPSPFGYTWLGQPHHRGSWYYACEIDLGYCGALRCAAAILVEDPIFGLFCYGGDLIKTCDGLKIIVKDGIRKRFHVLLKENRFHLTLDTDYISGTTPIFIKEDFSQVVLEIENTTTVQHSLAMTIAGLPQGMYGVYIDDVRIDCIEGGDEKNISLPIRPQGGRLCISKESVSV